MKIAAICPTYKRPELLGNSIACFLAQETQPHVQTRLFILDDAAQFRCQKTEKWEIESTGARFQNLPDKYNHLAAKAIYWGADVLTIWEDDDVFLPWHLANAVFAVAHGVKFVRTRHVYSNYALPKNGSTQLEGAAGRFHSSWSFTTKAFSEVGGWPRTSRLDFDQQLNGKLCDLDPLIEGGRTADVLGCLRPSYVYRWGNNTYHGSQSGEAGFKALWDDLGTRPAPFVEVPTIRFDDETKAIYSKLIPDA